MFHPPSTMWRQAEIRAWRERWTRRVEFAAWFVWGVAVGVVIMSRLG